MLGLPKERRHNEALRSDKGADVDEALHSHQIFEALFHRDGIHSGKEDDSSKSAT